MKYFLVLLLTLSYLQASCKDYKRLGTDNQNMNVINSKDTILWSKTATSWKVSQPVNTLTLTNKNCKDSGYVLINDNAMKYKTLLHHKGYYDIKKGWNYFTSPIDGIDIDKTFLDVEFVYVYDDNSRSWAGYSPKPALMKKIKSTRILHLKYIEPKRGFYVLSNKVMRVAISSNLPNAQCQKIMKDKNYDLIFDSGIDNELSYNRIKSVALASRYHSHNRKGIYDDSRVIIMVPKLKKLSTNKKAKIYGPAIPKMKILFNEAYEEKEFYAYDFLNAECRKGYFPSNKKPPEATLKKVK